jgi:hypothetical protein
MAARMLKVKLEETGANHVHIDEDHDDFVGNEFYPDNDFEGVSEVFWLQTKTVKI